MIYEKQTTIDNRAALLRTVSLLVFFEMLDGLTILLMSTVAKSV